MSSNSGDAANNSSSTGDANSSKKGPFCARCRNHKELNRIQGHKRYCKFQKCTCTKCLYVKARQVVTRNQVKEKRRSAIDEKLRSEGRLQDNSEPSIPSLEQELQSLASSTLNKSDSELDSALLDFFLARIHIDTEAFFRFIKSFLKQKVKELQVKLRNPKSTQEQATSNSTCLESLVEVKTTNDESNIFNSMETDNSSTTATATTITTGANATGTTIEKGPSKEGKSMKNSLYQSKKVAAVKHIPLQNKFGQLNGIQWQGFNLNYTIQNSSPSAERTAKPNVIELMSSDTVANSNSLLPDDLLARYAYFAALNQIYSSSTYCSPSTSSSFN